MSRQWTHVVGVNWNMLTWENADEQSRVGNRVKKSGINMLKGCRCLRF